MRILHVEKLPFAQGGVARYVAALMDLQRRGGHEVDVFGCSKPGGVPPDWPEYFDFTAARSVWAGAAALPRMIHNSDAAGRLHRLLCRRRYDVAHLHNVYHHLTPSILPVLARHRVAIVMTLHDYRLACPTRHFLRADGPCTRCLPNRFAHAASRRCAGLGGAGLAVESFVQRLSRRYFAWVDVFLCPTRFMARVAREAGVPRGKTAVVPNVIAPPPLSPGQAQNPCEVLFAGRLSREKAPDLMLALAAGVPDVQVTLAGDGPMASGLRAEAHRRGLRNVTFAGSLGPDEMAVLLGRAAAVVVPSRCMENSPQVMLEALWAGRCAIVPDQEPLREWVRDGQTGRTFQTGDADSLTRTVREVLADPSARCRMARAGQDLVRRRHSPARLAETIERLYHEGVSRCALRW